MKSILEQFYEGELYPAEQCAPFLEEHLRRKDAVWKREEAFAEKLSEPLRKELDEILDDCAELRGYEAEEAYIDGMRMGARLALELFMDKTSAGFALHIPA